MKRQYLGDSKDSFKWDYLDYLTTGLDYPLLNVVLMLTPDDNSKQGKTKPELFPSREQVIDFCRVLKKQKDFQLIKKLPKSTGSKYRVELHKEVGREMGSHLDVGQQANWKIFFWFKLFSSDKDI